MAACARMAVTSASAALGSDVVVTVSVSRPAVAASMSASSHLLEELEPRTWHSWLKWNQIV